MNFTIKSFFVYRDTGGPEPYLELNYVAVPKQCYKSCYTSLRLIIICI